MAVFSVTNTADAGAGSLRQAMTDANQDAVLDTIQFNIPGSGVKTIAVTSELPAIITPMIIDGWSEPGFTSKPQIKIQGSAEVNYGLSLYSTGSVVRGLILNSFHINQLAIWGGDQNRIQGNYFGLNNTGSALEGDLPLYDAVFIGDGSIDNVIGVDGDGVSDSLERNYVGGGQSGIGLWGAGSMGNRIAGNYIGTNLAKANLGNRYAGVWLEDGANDNIIGSNLDGVSDALEANFISRNGTNGIVIHGAGTERNRISRNLVWDNIYAEIDLGNDGTDANDNLDADSGPNRHTNYPDLTSLVVGATSITVGGTLDAEASTVYRVEFFGTAAPDPSGQGGSRKYLGAANVKTNASGRATFSRTLNSTIDYGWLVTATATDPVKNTSEFSAAIWDGLDLSQTFSLASNPAATKTIYLDFNGHTTTNTQWNLDSGQPSIVTPAFSLDADPAFSVADKLRIQSIYQRVVEDFRPFAVNVTTLEPAAGDLIKSGALDERWGIRVAIGGSWQDWYGSPAGGLGYNESFALDSDTPVFCFSIDNNNNGAALVADNISHEVGHSLGLSHDGTSSSEYYDGHGSGETSWNSLMGGGSSANLTQWSRGDYLDANNPQDDLLIITTQNGFGYVADDYGNGTSSAAALSSSSGGILTTGAISKPTDLDFFYFETSGGAIDLSFTAAQQGPNLDIRARLLNESGSVILVNSPIDLISARLKSTLLAGRYYVSVDGVGRGTPLTVADGYTDYGSLGGYAITGTVSGLNTAPLLAEVSGTQNYTNNNTSSIPIASQATVTDNDSENFLGGTLRISITEGADASNRILFNSPQFTRSGNQILLNNVLFGTLNGQAGIGETDYIVTFTAVATPQTVQTLIRAFRFRTIGNSSTTVRKIALTLTDGDGGTSNTEFATIHII